MIFKTWLIVILFLTQIAFAFVISPLTGWNDIYPLFHWRLFARVYKIRQTPLLYLKEVDGTRYAKPIVFYDFFQQRGKDFMASMYDDLDQIVMVSYKEPHRLKQTIELFEKKYFLDPSSVSYQIADAKIDLKHFYETKEVIELRVIYENTVRK